jgi:hypothetical protein
MSVKKLLLLGAAIVGLTACDSNPEELGRAASPTAPAYPSAPMGMMDGGGFNRLMEDRREADGAVDMLASQQAFGGAGEPAPAPPPPAPPSGPDAAPQSDNQADAEAMLAYRYGASIELPARNVRPVMTAHEEACRAAGPATCQILSANVSESGPDYVYGSLSLRAEPAWLATFRGGLEGDAEGAEGRVIGATVYAEDLTRYIVDTDARLRAQRVLRERLERLLETEQGDDVGDLLAVERELARVQGEIDSATSQLEVMRNRVEMSILDLNYQSQAVPLSRNAFTPLSRALDDFFLVLSESGGALVRFVAAALPWMLLVAPILWLIGGWWRARRARRSAAARA